MLTFSGRNGPQHSNLKDEGGKFFQKMLKCYQFYFWHFCRTLENLESSFTKCHTGISQYDIALNMIFHEQVLENGYIILLHAVRII